MAEEGERVDILVVVIVVVVIVVVMTVIVVVIMMIIVVVVVVMIVIVVVIVIMVMIIIVVDFECDEAAVALECHVERLVGRANCGCIVSRSRRLDSFRLVELHVTTGFVKNCFIHVLVVMVIIVVVVIMVIIVVMIVIVVVIMMIIVVVVIVVVVVMLVVMVIIVVVVIIMPTRTFDEQAYGCGLDIGLDFRLFVWFFVITETAGQRARCEQSSGPCKDSAS